MCKLHRRHNKEINKLEWQGPDQPPTERSTIIPFLCRGSISCVRQAERVCVYVGMIKKERKTWRNRGREREIRKKERMKEKEMLYEMNPVQEELRSPETPEVPMSD